MIYAGNPGMGAAVLNSGRLFMTVGTVVAACLFFRPAIAGDNTQVVPVYSDARGNQAWVEVDTEGKRSTATPFVAVDEGGLRKLLANPEDNGCLTVPVPRLMRLVERARKAIEAMKKPTANAPACPGAAPGAAAPAGPAAAPDRANPSGPPGETTAGVPSPTETYNTATR